jgi:hypothetical protein
MIRLDDALVEELGLGELSNTRRAAVLSSLYDELELRIGTTLAQRMTDQQLEEFEIFIDSEDDDGALDWLERNLSDYREVVQREFDTLKSEISAQASAITAIADVYDES